MLMVCQSFPPRSLAHAPAIYGRTERQIATRVQTNERTYGAPSVPNAAAPRRAVAVWRR